MATVARAGFNAAAKRAPAQGQVRWSGSMQAVKLKMASIANIGKITKAMKMVAASKLKGAETRVAGSRPMSAAMKGLFESLEKSEENPDGVELSPSTVCLVPVTSDKGLCGGVNTLLVKMVAKEHAPSLDAAGIDYCVVSVGDKGRSQLRRMMPDKMSGSIINTFQAIPPNFSVASMIADMVLEEDKDQQDVCFQTFKSIINQVPTVTKVPSFKLIQEGASSDPFVKFETEDERTETFENFCEFNLAVTIYSAMLENSCSEIASRMAAMDNATNNSNEMFEALQLKYNKARQAAITTELIEIISGAESLKG
jgi:F-type H+-transporting ATPase subunit gamma